MSENSKPESKLRHKVTKIPKRTFSVAVDGVAYRYDILYNDERYEFDSCVEDTENEVLFKTLREYFDIFSAQHNN